jgi:hypothetical protein
MFISPIKTFDSLRAQPRWFYPLSFSAAVSAAANLFVVQRIGLVRLVEAAFSEKTVIDPQSAIQNVLAHQGQVLGVQSTSIMANTFVTALVTAMVFWLLLTLFGFDISFKKALAGVVHANMPPIVIKGCLITLTAAVIQDVSTFDLRNPLATNIAFFLQPSSPVAFRILIALDAIKIMNLVLLIMGLTRLCPKLPVGRASILVLIPWAIYVGGTIYIPFF